eukprot:m.182600 g.182600  ORF g.182600 m.182600 type:complete len:385 (+) comp39295_c0_seq27:2080-3234(+)
MSVVEQAVGLLLKKSETHDRRLSAFEAFLDAQGGFTALSYSHCTMKNIGRLYFDISKQTLMICNGSSWVFAHPSISPSIPKTVPHNCADVARQRKTSKSGHYFVYDNIQSKFVKVYCDLEKKISFGGDGSTKSDAGMSCKTIKDHWPKQASSRRWINPEMASFNKADGEAALNHFFMKPVGEAFEIYCDFESFGGGWSLVYSSRDNDDRRHSNMQNGTRANSGITSLDPKNDNKRFAYDVFETINSGAGGYNQVMLTGYQDYQNKANLVKMYFSKVAENGTNFTQFIENNIGKLTPKKLCGTKCYRGTELSSGKTIVLSWEDRGFVAGAGDVNCAWTSEVWNEIDEKGGHLLAPAEWNKAEIHNKQTFASGACRNRGLFHVFIR